MIEPRCMTSEAVAEYLGYRSAKSFQSRLPVLRANGFPPRIAGLHRWDRAAIDRWLDEQSGITHDDPADEMGRGLDAWAASLNSRSPNESKT